MLGTVDAETYLRQFAESQLRHIARGETTADDGVSRIDAVAAALAPEPASGDASAAVQPAGASRA